MTTPYFYERMSVDECGLNSKRDHIFFPMWKYDKDKDKFKMVRRRFKLEIPSRIDMEFFAKIVSTIRTDRASGCDWSWIGLKRNILQPNRDHIKEVMGIDDFFVDRLFKYGETLFEYWDYDCTFSDDENGIPFSYKTFFTERELVCEEN